MPNYCKNFKAILVADDSENSQKLITRTRCKQWTCSYCAGKNRLQWRARIIDHINKHSELNWSWFTLTAHRYKRGADKSLANLRDAWEKLIKRIKRKYAHVEKLHYCRVFEQHKDGSYHVHCIISLHWDSLKTRKGKDGKRVSYDKWLADTAKELKIGYYTHADNFDGKHAGYIAGYVTKYMTKMSQQFKKEIGRVRHIQTSQGWSGSEYDSEYEWQVKSGYYDYNFEADKTYGITPIDVQTGQEITWDDYAETYVYPPEFDYRSGYE